MQKCDVCGKDTVMDDGITSVSGMTIELRDDSSTHKQADYLQKQIGVYELGRKYIICFECLLRAMGVRPEIRE